MMRALSIGVFALLLAGSVHAQSSVPLALADTVIYRDTGAIAGTAFSIPVFIGEDVTGKGIRSADIVVSYDPAVLSLTNFEVGGLIPSAGCAIVGGQDTGEINVRIACGSSTPLAGGPGALITFTGTLVAEGASALTFTDETPFNEGGVEASITQGRLRIVTDPNPSLTPFEDRTIDEDGSTEYTFTLADADNDPDEITVSASASSGLVDASGFVVAACDGQTLMDACRTLTVTPVADAFGATTVTVVADDNSTRSVNAEQTFELTVTSINDLPTLIQAIDDQDIPVGNLPRRIELATVFSDVEGALQYDVSSSAPAVASVAVDNGDLVVTPASVGMTTISITATDSDSATIQDAFELDVTSEVSTGEGGPLAFRLLPSTPNPTSAGTRIQFDLPSASTVSLSVYDAVGREVVALQPRAMAPGADRSLELTMDGQPAGVYIVRLQAELDGAVQSLTQQLVVAR